MNPGQDQDLFKSTGIFSSSSSLASISLTFLKHKQINQCCLQDKDISEDKYIKHELLKKRQFLA